MTQFEMYTIETGKDTEEVIKFLEDKIYDHNSVTLNQFNGNLFSWVIKNNEGLIIAGIAGWTWANSCEITQLWVNEISRHKGLGKTLLEKAEHEAKIKKCNQILIKSYSFQAPHFYIKMGYEIDHVQKDFPQGHNYYILTKKLDKVQ
ncbi:MAG: GNAT family N-acetyltransferase [Bacteroidetes bacterium]|nr:GNAT family N-acetyltransferase [Bacteroidota bacterium]